MQYVVEKEHPHPLTLKVLKEYLRISHDYDDELLKKLSDIAVSYAELFLRYSITVKDIKVSFLKQEYKSKITLPIMYAQKILSVAYISKDQGNEALDENSYRLLMDKNIVEIDLLEKPKDLEICYQTRGVINSNIAISQGVLVHVEQLYEKKSNHQIVSQLRDFYKPYRRILL